MFLLRRFHWIESTLNLALHSAYQWGRERERDVCLWLNVHDNHRLPSQTTRNRRFIDWLIAALIITSLEIFHRVGYLKPHNDSSSFREGNMSELQNHHHDLGNSEWLILSFLWHVVSFIYFPSFNYHYVLWVFVSRLAARERIKCVREPMYSFERNMAY